MRKSLSVLVLCGSLSFCGNNGLEHLVDDVKSLRREKTVMVTTRGADGLDVNVSKVVDGYATASPVYEDLDYVYYVTNKHMMGKGKYSYELCDGIFDNDPRDDVRVKPYKVSEDNDLALLRAKKRKDTFVDIPRFGVPLLGEEVYTVGYPLGIERLIKTGRVASGLTEFNTSDNDFGKGYWIDSCSSPGNSGSPVYVLRGGEAYLVGVVAGGSLDLHYTFIVDIKEVEKLVRGG